MSVPSALLHNDQTLAKLAKELDLDGILSGITEASEETLAKVRLTRTLTEAASPEGTLELTRVWRTLDAVLGPGKSTLEVLLARYSRLQDITDRMAKQLNRGLRARADVTRRLALASMDNELKAFSRLKSEVLIAVDENIAPIRRKLTADMEDKFIEKISALSSQEVKKECQRALEEMELAFKNQRKALSKGVDARPGSAVLEARARALVTKLKATKQTAERAVIASRIKRLSEWFPDPQKIAAEFAKKIKSRVGRVLPALEDIEDSAVVFMDALGVAASARPDGARLLRRYVENGAGTLTTKELERINGYLGQIRGLLPEEIANRMKFLDSVFHKRAFEALAEFPPALRSRMSVEMVEGPLWVIDQAGAPRQFGDGCMLLTGPDGRSAIVGLGEFKAGFDEDLLTQLFVRSDGRAVSSKVTFLGSDGNEQIRTLTREFPLGEGKNVSVTPTYVYGRPAGETEETAARFKEMVDEQMRSGREVWKVPLPFSSKSNDQFAHEVLKEAVNTLKKAKRKNWGR
jgi:hypothetical protein